MKDKAFIDTNVFVYSFDRVAEAKAKIARDLIQTHIAARTGAISFQVIQEFYCVASKRFPSVMRLEDANSYLMTVFRPLASVNSSLALYLRALSVRERHKISWYDSLILAAAGEARCSVIYTEDLHHGASIDGVRVENPFRSIPPAPAN